jgi:glycopeptide antibiotics resistance protein
MLVSTVFSRKITNPYGRVFNDFGIMVNGKINREFFENVLLFIPYSFLYLKAFSPKRSIKSALAMALLTTAFIEMTQLLLWLGRFQISDLVHNLMGGLIGIGVWFTINGRSIKKSSVVKRQ